MSDESKQFVKIKFPIDEGEFVYAFVAITADEEGQMSGYVQSPHDPEDVDKEIIAQVLRTVLAHVEMDVQLDREFPEGLQPAPEDD